MREARDRECNSRAEVIIGINNKLTDMENELDSYQDESGISSSSLVSTEVEACMIASYIKVCRIASKLDGVSECSKGVGDNQRDRGTRLR